MLRYYSVIWSRERQAFRRGLDKWLNELGGRKEYLVSTLESIGKGFGLFEHELSRLKYQYFRIHTMNVHKYRVYSLPTWILEMAIRISKEVGENPHSVSKVLRARHKIHVPAKTLWIFFKNDPVRIVEEKKRHDKMLWNALRVVGSLEGDFVLAVESGKDLKDLKDIYEEFALKFKLTPLDYLLFFAANSSKYPALIDSAIIDALSSQTGLKPPGLWRKVVEKLCQDERIFSLGGGA